MIYLHLVVQTNQLADDDDDDGGEQELLPLEDKTVQRISLCCYEPTSTRICGHHHKQTVRQIKIKRQTNKDISLSIIKKLKLKKVNSSQELVMHLLKLTMMLAVALRLSAGSADKQQEFLHSGARHLIKHFFVEQPHAANAAKQSEAVAAYVKS